MSARRSGSAGGSLWSECLGGNLFLRLCSLTNGAKRHTHSHTPPALHDHLVWPDHACALSALHPLLLLFFSSPSPSTLITGSALRLITSKTRLPLHPNPIIHTLCVTHRQHNPHPPIRLRTLTLPKMIHQRIRASWTHCNTFFKNICDWCASSVVI